VNFSQNLKAKLLMLHGENDPRCPLTQASRFRATLLQHGQTEGRDFEYIALAAEGHGSQDVAQKTRAYQMVVNFLERNL
jgi:dipeptidyl aminopeptidase/acylaminoacyl peptidase